MNQFIKKCILLGLIFSCLFCLYNLFIYKNIDWEKVNHFELREAEHFDIVMLNSSRGINIAGSLRDYYNIKVLGVGGGGVRLQQVYLEYLSLKKNTSEYILYFIEPHCFCNSKFEIPENSFPQKAESDFFFILLNKFGLNWLIKYIRNYSVILENQAIPKEPIEFYYNKIVAAFPDSVEIEQWNKKLYRFCENEKGILEHREYLNNTVSIIQNKFAESKFIFIITPSLLGEEPYKAELVDFLEEMKKEYDIPYYDLSDKPASYEYFHDLDHLNQKGGAFFNKEYLFPILKEN